MSNLIERTTEYIVGTQQPGGGIPWFEGGIIDPWDHVESAMGLTIGGRTAEAEAAYAWLKNHQHEEMQGVQRQRRPDNVIHGGQPGSQYKPGNPCQDQNTVYGSQCEAALQPPQDRAQQQGHER